MKSSYLLASAILFVVALGFWAFASRTNNDTKKVATSIYATYSLTSQIAQGGDIEIVNLLPTGTSPHQFQPTAQDQLRLSSVDKVFVIGHELDDWASNTAMNVNPDVKIVSMDKGIDLLEFEEEHGDESEEQHGQFDPHYWLSVENAKIMAANIKDELIELDSANSNKYLENYNNLIASLNNLKAENNTKTQQLSARQVITFHDAFNYLAKELGIEVVATVEEFPGQTPSPAYIAQVGAVIKEHQVKVLFKEPELSDEVVAALASDYGATVKTLDPLESSDPQMSYQDLIRYNVDTILQALSQNQ